MTAKETVAEVIGNHNLIHLASVDETGTPCVRAVDYAADENQCIYFMTGKDSRKVKQIQKKKQIGFSIDHDCPTPKDLQELKYIKGSAEASIVTDGEEIRKGMGLLMTKFPFLKDLPGDPSDFVTVKVKLMQVLVTDNTISFGHTETLEF